MYAIYETLSGELRSIGSVLGDNIASTLTVVELTDFDAKMLISGEGIWNPVDKCVANNPNFNSVEEKTIPISAIQQLEADMQNPEIVSVDDIKSSILSFVSLIK